MLTRVLSMIAFAALALAPACGGGGGSGPDVNGCCPPDPMVTTCMALGGYSPGGCAKTCDFYCSTNWRMETDEHSCPIWRYDIRTPQPGENQACMRALDAGVGSN